MSLTTSVVLCTWNGARFLPAQWASVLKQSRLPDEIVVRDDASTDGTPELLADLAAEARQKADRDDDEQDPAEEDEPTEPDDDPLGVKYWAISG